MIECIYRWWKLRRIKSNGPLYVIEYEYLTVWNIDAFGIGFTFGHKSCRLMTDEELLNHHD